jgi:hypothetical protein
MGLLALGQIGKEGPRSNTSNRGKDTRHPATRANVCNVKVENICYACQEELCCT